MGRAAEELAVLQWQHHPPLCPLQVPKIMKCLQENLEGINRESEQQSMKSLLLLLTNRYPAQVAISLVTFSPPGHRYRPQQP